MCLREEEVGEEMLQTGRRFDQNMKFSFSFHASELIDEKLIDPGLDRTWQAISNSQHSSHYGRISPIRETIETRIESGNLNFASSSPGSNAARHPHGMAAIMCRSEG